MEVIKKSKYDILIGKIFENNDGLQFKIIKRVKTSKNRPYFQIKFLKTGYITNSSEKSILSKSIKDHLNPSKYGVGYFENSNSKIYNKKAYKKWDAMLSRCYNKNNVQYKNYGGNGCFVCDRWHSFKNFVEDLPNIDGWNQNKFEKGLLQLDKDIKIKGNKIYSKENCSLVTQKENMKIIPSVMKEFVAIDPNNVRHEGYNVSEFARNHNLTARTISKVLNKKLHTHKGWKFYYKENL